MLKSRVAVVAMVLLSAACIWSSLGHVLVVVPAARGLSPGMDVLAVAGELKSRGHHLYLTAAAPEINYMQDSAARHQPKASTATSGSNSNTGKFTFVTYPAPFRNLKEEFTKAANSQDLAKFSLPTIMRFLQKVLMKPCEALFTNATAIKVLQESGAEAVLSFGLPIDIDSCGCVVAHLLGVPLIAVDGNPMVSSPISTPQFPSGLTRADLKTWQGYFTNMVVFFLKKVGFAIGPKLTDPGWHKLRAKNNLPPVTAVPGRCSPTLRLKMTSFLLEYPQPLPPGQMLLGPVSPRLPRPPSDQQAATPDVWAFLQGSSPEAGVVLVGFGSTGLFGSTLHHTDYVELAAGFSALAPTRVLWPLIPTNLPNGTRLEELPLGDNVLVVPWVDYNDVLGHPNTRVFVTHFGIHSKMEAAFHGVPIVGVPFQFEQAANGLSLVDLGMGEMCRQAVAYRTGRNAGVRFERNALRDLIAQVMTDPKYAEAAARISAKMQLYYSFRTPVQRAADEAEVLLVQPLPRSTHRQQQHTAAAAVTTPDASLSPSRDGHQVSNVEEAGSKSHQSEL